MGTLKYWQATQNCLVPTTQMHTNTLEHTQFHTMFSLSVIYLDSKDVVKFSTVSLSVFFFQSCYPNTNASCFICLVMAVQIQNMKFNEVLNEGFSNCNVWEKTNSFYGYHTWHINATDSSCHCHLKLWGCEVLFNLTYVLFI